MDKGTEREEGVGKVEDAWSGRRGEIVRRRRVEGDI